MQANQRAEIAQANTQIAQGQGSQGVQGDDGKMSPPRTGYLKAQYQLDDELGKTTRQNPAVTRSNQALKPQREPRRIDAGSNDSPELRMHTQMTPKLHQYSPRFRQEEDKEPSDKDEKDDKDESEMSYNELQQRQS